MKKEMKHISLNTKGVLIKDIISPVGYKSHVRMGSVCVGGLYQVMAVLGCLARWVHMWVSMGSLCGWLCAVG
jgi:hypothetical protein